MSGYNYDRTRTKVADEWSTGANEFIQNFDKLVKEHHARMRKGMVSDVAKLVKKFADSLTGYEFRPGFTPESVAKNLLSDVFESREGGIYDKWSLENFLRQGYMGLEREEIDLTEGFKVLRKAIEDFARKAGMAIRSLDVKRTMFKDRLFAKVEWRDEPTESWGWVDDLEKAIVGPLAHWAQSKGLGRLDTGSIETIPDAGGVEITVYL